MIILCICIYKCSPTLGLLSAYKKVCQNIFAWLFQGFMVYGIQ